MEPVKNDAWKMLTENGHAKLWAEGLGFKNKPAKKKQNTYYLMVLSNAGHEVFTTKEHTDLSKCRTLFRIFCRRFEGFEVALFSVKHISPFECRASTLKRKLYWKDQITTI